MFLLNYRISLACAVLAAILGCRPVPPQITPPANQKPLAAAESVDPEVLRQRIDHVLEFTLTHRQLSTQGHAAWQILHGSLAYGRGFPVQHDDQKVSAVNHLLKGGKMNGWTIQRGYALKNSDGTPTGSYGMRAIVEPGTRAGQGHNDQWLAVLSQCGLQPGETFVVGDDTYTMTNFLQQVQLDTSRNVNREFSWTLIGLTRYFPTDHRWKDATGKDWSIADLVQAEVDQGLESAACGGTHRLIGLAMALETHKKRGAALTGPWAEAASLIQESIESVRRFQNPNGALSANYVSRPGSSPDLAQNLGTTGHTLEFLSIAMSEDDLRQEWVRRAASYLCEVFERTEQVDLECGALYHAAHGLVLYRNRVYGPREFELAELD